MGRQEDTFYASSYAYSDNRIEFSETDEKKRSSTYFTLEKINDHKTRLTLDFYLKKSVINQLIFNLLNKRKMREIFRKSIVNIEGVIKEIKLPA